MLKIKQINNRGEMSIERNEQTIYSGNRLRSTARDKEKVLTLSEVDLIHTKRHM